MREQVSTFVYHLILASAVGAFWGWIASLFLNNPLTRLDLNGVTIVGAVVGIITFELLRHVHKEE